MKNGRINERNTGKWSLESAPKRRKAKKQHLTDEEKRLLLICIKLVHGSLAYNAEFSDGKGHLHPEARFTDTGILANFSRKNFEKITDGIEKLEADGW